MVGSPKVCKFFISHNIRSSSWNLCFYTVSLLQYSRAKLRVPFFTVILQFLKCLSHSRRAKEEDTPYQILYCSWAANKDTLTNITFSLACGPSQPCSSSTLYERRGPWRRGGLHKALKPVGEMTDTRTSSTQHKRHHLRIYDILFYNPPPTERDRSRLSWRERSGFTTYNCFSKCLTEFESEWKISKHK